MLCPVGMTLLLVAKVSSLPDSSMCAACTMVVIMTTARGSALCRSALIWALCTGGDGIWPAFWMLPAAAPNGSLPYGVWPRSGEIDIMESVNSFNQVRIEVHLYSCLRSCHDALILNESQAGPAGPRGPNSGRGDVQRTGHATV